MYCSRVQLAHSAHKQASLKNPNALRALPVPTAPVPTLLLLVVHVPLAISARMDLILPRHLVAIKVLLGFAHLDTTAPLATQVRLLHAHWEPSITQHTVAVSETACPV